MESKTYELRMLWAGSVDFAECIYHMGIGVLSEHLRKAAQYFIEGTPVYHGVHAKYKNAASQKMFRESIAFVEGTGLNLVIEDYGLEVDPETFRETFFQWIQEKKRKR